jgi:hypothetical protein
VIPPPDAPPPPPTPAGEPVRASRRSRGLRTTIIAVVIIVIVLAGIIGYAVTGLAYAQTKVGNANRKLSTVISHQNSLTATFTDLNAKFNTLSSSSSPDPQQERALFDQFVANEKAAGTTDTQDDKSLVSARASLGEQQWLTLAARGNLDKEATKIDHARKALSIAKTAAAGYVQEGQFFQAYFDAAIDLEMLSSQVANADLSGATTTLTTMKTHVDKALQLSSAPGLPAELHALMVDFGTFVTDFGKLLAGVAAGDDSAITSAENAVQTDAAKLGTYNMDTILAEIGAYYKPMFDAVDSEMAKAAA